MGLTAGALSLITKSDTKATVSSAVATGGTTPYSYQWYRSTTSGFSPGGGNILTGKTSLQLADTGLIPNTTYYYKVVATDSAGTPATATSSQLEVTTDSQSLSPNQFNETPTRGMLDQRLNFNTISAQIDASETGILYPGSPVKIYDSAGGVPKVVACSADSDEVLGFINFDIKSRSFVAGDSVELSIKGNVMFLYATAAIARGAKVALDLANNGVKPISGSGGEDIVGWAYDKASAQGDLIRVYIETPYFGKDA